MMSISLAKQDLLFRYYLRNNLFIFFIQVTCNLDDMSRKYCVGFDLRAELEKGSLPSEAAIAKPRRRIR